MRKNKMVRREGWRLFEGFEDKGVGAVDDRGVEGSEIDTGGRFGIVAHAFADDADGYAFK